MESVKNNRHAWIFVSLPIKNEQYGEGRLLKKRIFYKPLNQFITLEEVIFSKCVILKTEINFDAKRSISTYKRIFRNEVNVFDINYYFPQYPSIPYYLNTTLSVIEILKYCSHIEVEFENLRQEWREMHQKYHFTIPYSFKIRIFDLVIHMRRVIDSLIALTYILVHYKTLLKDYVLRIDSIGESLKRQDDIVSQIIFGNDKLYKKDETNFLRILNNLSNSFKHSVMHCESESIYSRDKDNPSIVSYYQQKNRFNQILEDHNHSLCHFVMGFQDTFVRILENQKIWISNNLTEYQESMKFEEEGIEPIK